MKNRCLYCYEELNADADFHEACSLVFFGSKKAPRLPYSLNEMEDLAKEVVERSVSVPGVQPKLSMSVIKDAKERTKARFTVVGALGGFFIFKPPSEVYPEMPQNEHLTLRIAEAFRIRVVPSSLIRLESGELSFITKRIDRTPGNEKIHMLDMFQILEAFDKYKGSMEKVGNAIGNYSSNSLLDRIFFFELALFSFLTGNSDMHLKNFSMINSGLDWTLAPAYDLLNVHLLMPEDLEEMALTIGGRKNKINRQLFENFGKDLGLNEKQITSVFKRFFRYREKAVEWVKKSFLSDEMRSSYLKIFEERYRRVNIM